MKHEHLTRAFGRCGALMIVLATLLGFAFIAPPARAQPQEVLRATLENGLRVVIVRNTLAAAVTTAVNYLVGGDDAPEGFPGMAHAQEHMMFRGSAGLTADQLTYLASMMGGNFNADTRETVTQYYFSVPAEDLDVALHIEALRMHDVLDNQKDWEKERGAIEQEVAQDLSSPRYILSTKLREAMFAGTPYEHDALGTRPSFDRTTGGMLKSFYQKWYAPNNAVLIIVGNVDPQATLATVRQLFGDIPRKNLPPHPAVTLQPVKAQSLALTTDLSYGLEVVAFRLPGLDSPDYAAAEILSDVLSSQRGDLYGLVPDGKALFADFEYEPLPKAGLAFALGGFPSGGDGAALQTELRQVLAKIVHDGVPPELVTAAKLQEVHTAEFEKNSIRGLATVWSEAVAVDGIASPDVYLASIDKVTVADVNRVARKYLDLAHAVTAILVPEGSGKPVASAGFGGQESIALGEANPTQLPSWAEASLSHVVVPPSTLHPVVKTLPNGITLIVQPEDISDTVSVFGHVKNRPELQVPVGQEGLSRVLSELFSYGTEELGRVGFLSALDEIGADVEAGTNFSLEALAPDFDRGVALLAANELHPAFAEQDFAIVKHQVAQSVAGSLKSPRYLTGRAIRTALLPKDDPMLRESTPATIEALTLKDVVDYYHATFRPDLTTIVVVGHVTPEQAEAVIEKHFGSWSAPGPKPQTDLPPVPLNGPADVAVPNASRVQDDVVLAETLGINRSTPDYYALQLGNNVLSGAFNSTRLTRDLRKNAGLVYSVGSYLDATKTRGDFFVQYACDPQNVSKVSNMIRRELQDMQTTYVTPDELQQARAILLRRMPLSEASIDRIGQGFLDRAELDLPLDEPTIAAQHYLALSAADIQAAFSKWLRPDDLVRVSEGPTPQ